MENKKIALVYDWFDKEGGAERLFKILLEVFPNADIYTSYWDQDKIQWLKGRTVKQSFIKKFPQVLRQRKLLTLFYPFAFESFDLSEYDLVFSATAYFAKAVVTKPETKHICYLFTPPRFLWNFQELYFSKLTKFLTLPLLSYLRSFDYLSARRPDKYIFLSELVKKLAEKTYGITGEVVYPAFDFKYWQKVAEETQSLKNSLDQRFNQVAKKPYFLFISRLEPYKRADLFIQQTEYFKNCNFVVVGTGSQQKKLLKAKRSNLYFFQNLSDNELAWLYSNAVAFVMPQIEEFGYTALEALFFNTPLVIYSKSAVCEYAKEFSIVFQDQTSSGLKSALEKSITLSYNLKLRIKNNRIDFFNQFSKENFVKKLVNIINSL
ncbi:MAG: glycosyl transferase [Patescibacteria group bacterium]|nr:MAG: glycosyl transferase [Patescibacteria group bacterium]